MGLVLGVQTTTMGADVAPVVETTVNWVAPVVGLVIGALVGLVLARWWQRGRSRR